MANIKKKMKITNFQNNNICNPFNPVYSYYIAEDILPIDTKVLTQFLLYKEKELLKKYPPNYAGGTGVNKNSLTTRYIYYNLLEFDDVSFLKNYIRKAHDKFVEKIGVAIEKNYYVQCWYNVLRKKEKIKNHQHFYSNEGYLTGHICVNVNNTSTYYESPYFKKPHEVPNIPGQITLFPGWMGHYTDEVKEDFERVTIAFDIRTEKSYSEMEQQRKQHWIKI